MKHVIDRNVMKNNNELPCFYDNNLLDILLDTNYLYNDNLEQVIFKMLNNMSIHEIIAQNSYGYTILHLIKRNHLPQLSNVANYLSINYPVLNNIPDYSGDLP